MRPHLPCVVPLVCVQLIEDLRRELEHLQLYRLETERPGGRGSSSGLADFASRTREVELEHEVKRLKQVRRSTRIKAHHAPCAASEPAIVLKVTYFIPPGVCVISLYKPFSRWTSRWTRPLVVSEEADFQYGL